MGRVKRAGRRRNERSVKDGGAAPSEGRTEGRPGASPVTVVEAAEARQDVQAAPGQAGG